MLHQAIALLGLFVISATSHRICEIVNTVSKTAYTDWPFVLDCDHLENVLSNKSITDDPGGNCSITEGNFAIDSGIREFSSSGTRMFNVTLSVNDTICLTSIMTVQVSLFPDTSCDRFLNETKMREEILSQQTTVKDSFLLECNPPSGITDVIPRGANRNHFETVWKRSCAEDRDLTYRPNRQATIFNTKSEMGYPDNFFVGSVQYFDAGEYVCTVNYKDKTLNVVSRSVCVKQNIDEPIVSMVCQRDVRQAAGETAILECEASITIGPVLPGDLNVEWRKGSDLVCTSRFLNEESRGGKRSCIVTGSNDSIACVFDYNEGQDETKKIVLHLNVRDIGGDDFGEYKLDITFRGKSASGVLNLTEDLAPFYAKLALTLGLLFIVVVAVLCFVIYYRRNKLEFDLRQIRLFGFNKSGSHVYFTYFYDSESMTIEELERIGTIVQTVHSTVGRCYDIHRDRIPSGLPFSEQVAVDLGNSCASLLVITQHFVKCAERLYDAEQAFMHLLNEKKRMIIVMTVDGLEAMKESISDKVWSKIYLTSRIFPCFVLNDGTDDEYRRLRQFIQKHFSPPDAAVSYRPSNEVEIQMI